MDSVQLKNYTHLSFLIHSWSICHDLWYFVVVRYKQIDPYSSVLLSGVPDYFGRNKISSGGDLSHYSSASLY